MSRCWRCWLDINKHLTNITIPTTLNIRNTPHILHILHIFMSNSVTVPLIPLPIVFNLLITRRVSHALSPGRRSEEFVDGHI